MLSSLRTIETRRAPLGRVLGRARSYEWDTTPGRLRMAQIILVIGVLLAGGVGASVASIRAATSRDIAEHLEPLNATVITLYRSLADADATVAAGYLAGGVEPAEVRTRYSQDLNAATDSLARASNQAKDVVTVTRLGDITSQLPVYTGLVERARANNRAGLAVGASYLRRASELMQDSILPEAADLQRSQALRLDTAYRKAESVPIFALVAGVVTLAGLIWAQVFLFQRTYRVFNIGLVMASVAVFAGLGWWTVAGMGSASSLGSALGHSQSVSDALGPAQIAALQARASESLQLVTRSGDTGEPDFDARMQRLARDDGAGGALGAAERFASDRKGKALVQSAIGDARTYSAEHRQVRRLDDLGNYVQAVDAAVNNRGDGSAAAFDRLSTDLNTAVGYERSAFRMDIARARDWLTGLPIGTGVLALVSALGIAWGVQRRMEEYR